MNRPDPPDTSAGPLEEGRPVLIWRAAADGRRHDFNDEWLRFTGTSLEEAVGDGWIDSVHADDREAYLETYRTHLERHEPFAVEVRLRRHDGVHRWVADRGIPIEGGGLLGSTVDVHDRRDTGQTAATFLGLLAHEQRTPLTALKNNIEILRRRAAGGEALTDDAFRKLVVQCDRLAGLVDKLAETARLEAGRPLTLDREIVDLVGVVRTVASDLEVSIRERARADRGHTVELVTPSRRMAVRGDRSYLELMLTNIVDNAIKFSPRGGRVLIVLEHKRGEHLIAVTDRGIGVAAAELVRLGRRYFRASNASAEQFPGLGLGLALARDIAEAHRGRLQAEAAAGGGLTVTVWLPSEDSL